MVSLTECRIIKGFIVETDKSVEIPSFTEFLETYKSSNPHFNINLAKIERNSYIGKLVDGTSILIKNYRLTGDIRAILKKDPLFDTKIQHIYRIKSIDKLSKIYGAEALREG